MIYKLDLSETGEICRLMGLVADSARELERQERKNKEG